MMYPQDLQCPADENSQRFAPPPVQLCRVVAGSGVHVGDLRVVLKLVDPRLWVSLALVFEPDLPPVALAFGSSTIWTCLRYYTKQGTLPVANVRGTAVAPESWPVDAGLLGSLDEGITTACEVLGSLHLDAAALPGGVVVAYAQVASTYRLSRDEWQRVVSQTKLEKLDACSVLYGALPS